MDVLRQATDEECPGAWSDGANKAGLPAHPSAMASYGDKPLRDMLQDISTSMGVSLDEALIRIGRRAAGVLADGFPGAFDRHATVHGFLSDLSDVIHGAVRSEGSDPPVTKWEGGVLTYHSRRRLGPLALGLLRGVVDHYGSNAVVEPLDPLDREEVRFRIGQPRT